MKLDLYILSAKRSPVGTFMGALKDSSPVELGVLSSKAALEDAGVKGEEIAHSVFGNVCSWSSEDSIFLSRHIALKAGVRQSAGSLTVNRLCGSGFEALVQAAQWVSEGPVLCGGAENMSSTPLMVRGSRSGYKFARPPKMVDSLWEALTDRYAEMAMGETAELLAKEYKISREDCDAWALQSHQRAAKAEDGGFSTAERISVPLPKGQVLEQDEHIRRDSSAEKLAKLPAVFGGVTTAANASGMNDAAAALVVSDRAYAEAWMKRTGRKPLARVVGARQVGCDPKRMGLGPVEAVKGLSEEIAWNYKDLSYIEINEAFAAQILAVKEALGLSDEQLNPHGSGISIGHPLGATGARISTHIAHWLSSGKESRAIGGACIGGGQGIAVAFEAINA